MTNATMTSHDTLNERDQVAGTPDAMDHVLLERINRTPDALRDYGNGVKGGVRQELDLILQYAKRAYGKQEVSADQTETPEAPALDNSEVTAFVQHRMTGGLNRYYEAQVHTTDLRLSSDHVRALRIDFNEVRDKSALQPVIDHCIKNRIPIIWGGDDNRYFMDPRIPSQGSNTPTAGEDYYEALRQQGVSVGGSNEADQKLREDFIARLQGGSSFDDVYNAMPPALKDNLRGPKLNT